MGLRQLKREAEQLDRDYINALTPARKICAYKGVIVTACTIIKSITPPLLWGIAIRVAMEGAITALNELCPSEATKENKPA